MAQSSIREYDAKRMFAQYTHKKYDGILIEYESDITWFCDKNSQLSEFQDSRFVIKPDQLFGKRGKYGLVGINLDAHTLHDWWKSHDQKKVEIGGNDGKLSTFLIEPFVLHTAEYYVAIRTEREYDELIFSSAGWVDIEEHWESTKSIQIKLCRNKARQENAIKTGFNIEDDIIVGFLADLYDFFVAYGFSYLEVNPFVKDTSLEISCLDMVARVDTCESYRQRNTWNDLEFPHPFGPEKSKAEKYIDDLDSTTGASLKLRILNPDGRIWLLTSGGGASVIIADTLADMGLASAIGNYGECSGNPDRDNTRAYTLTLLEVMLRGEWKNKYLIIAWAIANFTHIDKTFAGIIDALKIYRDDLRKQDVHILVRRGGIYDTRWLQMMQEACIDLRLSCEIADGNVYMTDILKHITL